jgi:hypothetical protein
MLASLRELQSATGEKLRPLFFTERMLIRLYNEKVITVIEWAREV